MMMRSLAGYKPLYVEPNGTLWAGRGLAIVRSDDDGRSFVEVARYQGTTTDRAAAANRVLGRVLRGGFHGLTPLRDGGLLATVRKRLLKKDADADRFREVFRFPRGSRPLNLCQTPTGRVFFGEYFSNPRRDSVHVYGSADAGESWEPVHTFAPGAVRHVHGVFHDPFANGQWILTGDDDDESRILFTDDEFRHVDVVFQGSQHVRAATVVPTESGVIVPTDTPFQQNYIQWVDRQTGRIERVREIPGSVLHGCVAGDHAVISVAVESSRTNTCRDASIWVSRDGLSWRELYRRAKDNWPIRTYRLLPAKWANRVTMQHGAFVLPHGRGGRPIVYAAGQALECDDNRMLCWDLDEEAGREMSP